ncbi:MAG: sugar-binding protein [Propionibacteriaceae bacterium]|nr:sugar-binding protein [Propionibacteriaceae bacterium]
MKLKKIAAVFAAAALGLSVLAGCGDGGRTADPSETANPGFAADSLIGVSLPWLGTQNWKEAMDMFGSELEGAGYQAMVQSADNKVPQQQQQIEAMIDAGVSVLVVAPVDGSQLGSVLEKAKDAGIWVIGYDRLIENTKAVDAVVQFGSIKTGEVQGQSLLDGLAARKGDGPYNIELFGGGPADPNAPNFFTGAMSVLQPKIDDGTLVIVSGEVDFNVVATPDWSNQKAQVRMDSLLAAHYADKTIDGVLSPNDGIARAILTACEDAGQPVPVVDGLDAENESVISVWQGIQWSTVYKPTDKLVAETIRLINILQKGQALPAGNETAENGSKTVQVFALEPVAVTKDNAKEVFANDPERLALLV